MVSQAHAIDGIEPSQLEGPTEVNKQAGSTIQELPKLKSLHQWDPNLPQEKLDEINEAINIDDQEKAPELDKSFAQDSHPPYKSVRAAVRNTDGEEVANTVRAWVLGMFFTTIGSGLNVFLSMR
jgi:hypothetical protein